MQPPRAAAPDPGDEAAASAMPELYSANVASLICVCLQQLLLDLHSMQVL
jgi:hypothetical protein